MDLTYDPNTRRLAFSGQTRDQRREQDGTQAVVNALAELKRKGEYPASTNTVTEAMVGNKTERNKWIIAAEQDGLILRKKEGQTLLCSLTDTGHDRALRQVRSPRVRKSVARQSGASKRGKT